jgi:twitching motility two-component system response regulator PilG
MTPLGEETKNLTILVVDDSKTTRRTAEAMLGREGFSVVTAEDGFDSLAKIEEHKPDVIFLDVMMPKLDGFQTCAIIKKNKDFSATPVIMLSSRDSQFDLAKGKLVGADRYLTKPFSKEELLDAIKEVTES